MSVLYGFSFSAEFINIFNVSFFTRYTMRTMYVINNNTSNIGGGNQCRRNGVAVTSPHALESYIASCG